jgi:hypothetical protein
LQTFAFKLIDKLVKQFALVKTTCLTFQLVYSMSD